MGVTKAAEVTLPINVDVIVLSYAKSEKLRLTTEQGIQSLVNSESTDIHFNIIILESNKSLFPYQYQQSETLYPKGTFGFNKFINIGLKNSNNEYVCIANNDLLFHKGWASKIIDSMASDPSLASASPYCSLFHPRVGITKNSGLHYGYEIRRQVAGWCLFTRRSTLNIIGPFDENLYFWFCDNDYANMLKKHRLKHALVTNSIVDHLDGTTTETLTPPAKYDLTRGAFLYYDYKWNHRNRLLYFFQLIKHNARLFKLKCSTWN